MVNVLFIFRVNNLVVKLQNNLSRLRTNTLYTYLHCQKPAFWIPHYFVNDCKYQMYECIILKKNLL